MKPEDRQSPELDRLRADVEHWQTERSAALAQLKHASIRAYADIQSAKLTSGQIALATGLNASTVRKLALDSDGQGWKPCSSGGGCPVVRGS